MQWDLGLIADGAELMRQSLKHAIILQGERVRKFKAVRSLGGGRGEGQMVNWGLGDREGIDRWKKEHVLKKFSMRIGQGD